MTEWNDWPGSKSDKWKNASKKIFPIKFNKSVIIDQMNHLNFPKISNKVNNKSLNNSIHDNLIAHVYNEPKISNYIEKKQNENIFNYQNKQIIPKISNNYKQSYTSNEQITQSKRRYDEDYNRLSLFQIQSPINSTPKINNDFNKQSSNEYDVFYHSNKRKKLPNLEMRKNYIQSNSPGSKIYKSPEYSNKFFEIGGLVVGSTNTINYEKKVKRGYYDTLIVSKLLDKDKIYKNKVKKEEFETDQNYLRNIKDWEENILNKIS